MEARVARLLLKAVRGLPQREQDQVLEALLGSALAGSRRPSGPLPHARFASEPIPPETVLLSHPSLGAVEASGPTAMLPVRLPPELHERLRRWSNEHGFSMASVVRGLVERFLDAQEKPKPTPRRSGGTRTRPKGSTARG